jgi:hypothetical protein
LVSISEERLIEVLEAFFDERARVDAATHGEHHAWIKARIEAEQERKAMFQEIKKTAIGWSIPVLLGGVWYFLQHGHWPQ